MTKKKNGKEMNAEARPDSNEDPLERIGQVCSPYGPGALPWQRMLAPPQAICSVMTLPSWALRRERAATKLFFSLHTNVFQAVLARFGPAKLEGSDAEKISAIEARKMCTHEQAAMRRQVRGFVPAAVLHARRGVYTKVLRADCYTPPSLLCRSAIRPESVHSDSKLKKHAKRAVCGHLQMNTPHAYTRCRLTLAK